MIRIKYKQQTCQKQLKFIKMYFTDSPIQYIGSLTQQFSIYSLAHFFFINPSGFVKNRYDRVYTMQNIITNNYMVVTRLDNFNKLKVLDVGISFKSRSPFSVFYTLISLIIHSFSYCDT